nr:response regulator transcription factor [Pseudonocardia sp. C8]
MTERGPVSPFRPIWIVDDHPLVASSLATGLRAAGHDARVLAVPSAPEVVAALGPTTVPEVVLLDLELGYDGTGRRIDGAELVGPIRAAGRRVLALSDDTGPERIGAALAAGAAGAVPKSAPFGTLLAALRDTLHGRPVVPPVRRRELIERHLAHRRDRHRLDEAFAALTTREREILELLAAGRRAPAIADSYVVSVATVRTQIRGVLTKLGVNSQIEAVALYHRHRSVR